MIGEGKQPKKTVRHFNTSQKNEALENLLTFQVIKTNGWNLEMMIPSLKSAVETVSTFSSGSGKI